MKGLAGRTALVTGAGSGIGQAIAVRFAEEGANVAINYPRDGLQARDTEREIDEAVERCHATLRGHGVKTLLVQADVANANLVSHMFRETLEELGALDILVNNAGIQVDSPSDELEMEDFDRVLAVNLRGAFLCAREAIRHWLAEGRRGIILNVSSVNAIGPGATVTPINDGWVNDPEKHAEVEQHIPMGRAGTAEEMAGVAAFLCSDEAAYITGQTLFVDGGLTLYPDFRSAWSSK